MTIRCTYNLFDELLHEAAPGLFGCPLHGEARNASGQIHLNVAQTDGAYAIYAESPAAARQIRLDVAQTDDAYTIHAELPGVEKDGIQVGIEGSAVSIGAHIRQHDSLSGEGNQLLRTERYYGEVTRSVHLPVEIDRERASARYENGVLMLTLPKKNAPAPQRLTVE